MSETEHTTFQGDAFFGITRRVRTSPKNVPEIQPENSTSDEKQLATPSEGHY